MIWPFTAIKRNRKRQQDLAWLVRAAFERGYLAVQTGRKTGKKHLSALRWCAGGILRRMIHGGEG